MVLLKNFEVEFFPSSWKAPFFSVHADLNLIIAWISAYFTFTGMKMDVWLNNMVNAFQVDVIFWNRIVHKVSKVKA